MLKHLIFIYDGIWYTYGMDLYVGHTALRKTLFLCKLLFDAKAH